MKKVIASLTVVFFFGAALAQQPILQTDQTENLEIVATLESSDKSQKIPEENLCANLITSLKNDDQPIAYELENHVDYKRGVPGIGVGVASAVAIWLTAYSIGEDDLSTTEKAATGVATMGAEIGVIARNLAYENSIARLNLLLSESEKCVSSQECTNDEYVYFAQKLTGTDGVNMEIFSQRVIETKEEFCEVKTRKPGKTIIKIKSMQKIKRGLKDNYFRSFS